MCAPRVKPRPQNSVQNTLWYFFGGQYRCYHGGLNNLVFQFGTTEPSFPTHLKEVLLRDVRLLAFDTFKYSFLEMVLFAVVAAIEFRVDGAE